MAASVLIENIPKELETFAKSPLPTDAIMCEEVSNANANVNDPRTFKDICVIKTLNKAKFPVYLVTSKIDKKCYAMKVFPYSNGKPHTYFHNEARFSFVNHSNVIRTLHIENERETLSKGCVKKVSYTVMEYAPHGDFFDFVMKRGKELDDMLIRTYFRQLIDGLEYLHKNGVSHMDLKLENLLLGDNYQLKIADFDLSYVVNDPKIISRGTKFYRPPELIQGKCVNTQAADIYSAGIILFTLMTRGMLPHAEDSKVGGVDFAGLLYTQNHEFWNKHCLLQKRDQSYFVQDFKDLFNGMVRLNPSDRLTIDQIKQSKWYNGPCYTKDELRDKVERLFNH